MAQTVKNLSAMQETHIWYLGQEGPLEKGMATHSSIFAWRTTWTEEPGRLWSMVSPRVEYDWVTNTLPCSMYWPKHLGITQLNETWTLPSMILQLRRIKAILKLLLKNFCRLVWKLLQAKENQIWIPQNHPLYLLSKAYSKQKTGASVFTKLNIYSLQ